MCRIGLRTTTVLAVVTALSIPTADAQSLGGGAPAAAPRPQRSAPPPATAAPAPRPAVRAAPAPRLQGGGGPPRTYVSPGGGRGGFRGPSVSGRPFRQAPPAVQRRFVQPRAFTGRPALDAGRFAARPGARGFVTLGAGAYRPEFRYRHEGRWHRRSLGWSGPVFWPWAYGAVLGYTFWPYEAYDDPFWAYGPADIYDGLFWPGPVATPARPGRRATQATRTRTAECGQDTGDVALPIDRIQAAVGPDPAQREALDALGNATVEATTLIRSACPAEPSLTPTGRLEAMEKRLDAMTRAVALVQGPLDRFYALLSDEQKARFNTLGGDATATARAPVGSAGLCREADPGLTAWPGAAIEREVRPTEAQRAALDALKDATGKAADAVRAACPSEAPLTPPARLAAASQRLDAMLAAVRSVRAALVAFYGALDDEQKARFNSIGGARRG